MRFPKALQISYETRTIVGDLREISLIKDETLGRHQTYEGLNLIFDPEKYVDTGITLRMFDQETCIEQNGKESKVKIRTQINADFSKEHYYVY